MKFLAVFFAAFLGCCAAVGGVWSADRDAPTETISVKIEPETVPAGGQGEVLYVYQRYRQCARRSVVSIIDSSGRAFEFAVQNSPPTRYRVEGKTDTYRRPFRVPVAAQPGPGVYHVEIEDFCNPLHWLWPISRSIDIPFQIAPPAAMAPRPSPTSWRSVVYRIFTLR